MASANTWCYQNTIYSCVITQLGHLGPNKDKFVYCPHKKCENSFVKLYNRWNLYRHIEGQHPEDKKHTKNFLKYVMCFCLANLNNNFLTNL